MFIMLGVLLALNIALYINLNKRINYLKYLCTNSFKEFNDNTNSVYSHINSIYKNIKDLIDSNLKIKAMIDSIKLECSNVDNHLTAYIHKDNENYKKELINCMANSFTDMRKYISDTIHSANKDIVLDINKKLLTDIKGSITSIQQTLGDTNLDIKVISDKELAKISSMLKDTQNQLDCISKQIETCNKLKTATKSKSTKSDKPVIKKKTILL